MKVKYYLRGIGIGLLIGVIIMFAAMKTLGYEKKSENTETEKVVSNNTGSDKKTEKATEKTEKPTEVATEKTEKTTEATTEKTEKTTEATTEKTEKTTEATTEKTEKTTEATTEKTETTEATTEKTEETTEATTEDTEKSTDETTEKTTEDNGTVTIVVERGMYSTTVAKMLQDAGIVEDYLDFDRWLDATGYSFIIGVGEFSFHKGMTYEEIAAVLTGR
ncbi:hypothetical protein SAMN04487934_101409 [Eubacterium ruminantium]|nr:hypothetical protein SAMN04487934_101409 [Eubacterium ruminantium]